MSEVSLNDPRRPGGVGSYEALTALIDKQRALIAKLKESAAVDDRMIKVLEDQLANQKRIIAKQHEMIVTLGERLDLVSFSWWKPWTWI
jgi:uncharacterized coiled-coil protein SlyX